MVCRADLEILGSDVKMVGNVKWYTTGAPTVPGVKWDRAWSATTSSKLVASVYRGKTAKPLTGSQLKGYLKKILVALMPESKNNILSSAEGIGNEKEATNVAGTYLVKVREQYGRVILGLAQSGQTLIMVGTMFFPNDRVAGGQAVGIMESFSFKGTKLFKVTAKEPGAKR
jgi:hypothetical protein